jgi:hypothetical protein
VRCSEGRDYSEVEGNLYNIVRERCSVGMCRVEVKNKFLVLP